MATSLGVGRQASLARARDLLARTRPAVVAVVMVAAVALLAAGGRPGRPLDAVASGAVSVAAFAVACSLWVRPGIGRGARAAILVAGIAMASVLAVRVVAAPYGAPGTAGHPDLTTDRGGLVLAAVAVAVAALVVRHLVAELQRALRRIDLLARSDQLTGVLNRRAWDEEFARSLRAARRDRHSLCVALLDLDRFDAYNQLRGHPEGDRLLQRMAATWRQAVRPADVLARWDGVQFALLMRHCSVENAATVVERLRAAVPDEETASAGLVRWNGSDSAAELMRRAEESLTAAKHAGRDRVRIAESAAAAPAISDATRWTEEVHRLLDERGVVAAYQPVVGLDDGSIVAYEALARPDRSRVDISVEHMFSTAQRLGLGRDLDWLCRRAALAGATWLPRGIPVFVNCNVSGLVDPVHRVDQMLLLLEACGRDAGDVVLEITERELVGDLSRLKMVVSSYRREGFRFAVDDVGEGHSTLEVLAATSPDFVKIARSLVVDAATAGPRAAIRAVVAFADEVGAYTIAEGIETSGTAQYMRQLGVHLGQGWFFGRPELPPDWAPETLLSRTLVAAR
jgi:diguanylate cyclase (GGDEF)-like protein